MKRLRGLFGSCVLVVFLVVGVMPKPAPASGIPVIDIAGLAQSLQQFLQMVEQVNQLKNQVETAKNQLRTAEKELQQMSSVRGMAGIIGSAYDNDMDVAFDDILSNANIKAAEDYGLIGETASRYTDQNRAAAQWQARSEKFMGQAVDRFTELKKLVDKVNDAPDPKDIMDLQARIQGEEALLQNEMIKVQMMQAQAQAEQAMNNQKNLQGLLDIKGNPDNYRF